MSKRKYLLVCTLRRLSLDAWPSRPDKHVHPKVTHVYDDDGAASAAAAHSSRRGVASFISAAAAATACQAPAATASAPVRCSRAAASSSARGGGFAGGDGVNVIFAFPRASIFFCFCCPDVALRAAAPMPSFYRS